MYSSVTFAMRKQLQAEHGKADLEKKIAELEAKKTKQSNKVIELKSKIEAINTRNQERREVETKKRQEEIKFLKYQETHLSKFLKSVSDNNKWKGYQPGLAQQLDWHQVKLNATGLQLNFRQYLLPLRGFVSL